ncbi:MAG: pyruvate ferredoxin oxidoreductase subunit gamma [Armatimonadetes bacterium]|nr:pyruvate ferredoxin oxidoreductase subunit gamma [Armatimonadota bacterium]NIO74889.1 pyruvate ferredoxin oxidoreductase subunit gamma [Armatimonadota bacterium]NIO95650.1 pyruvate ferredoxin oxidoreductase subunit gamma [Armatimonadota bacterium]
MIQIRLHGRGGQGTVTAAELLASAAFDDGREAQAFPAFGVERRGAPVQAFCRISDASIRTRSQIYEPDIVIVQDTTLLGVVDVTGGLKSGGTLLMNTERDPKELGLNGDFRVVTVPATKIAMEILGRPITNTAIMGAFAAATGAISLEAIERNIKGRFRGDLGEKNVACAQRAYELVKGKEKK